MEAYIIILISLFFSAFFSGMELAYLSSNRLKIEVEKSQGTWQGKLKNIFYKNQSTMIALLLLGNNFALVIYGIKAADILNPILEDFGMSNEALLLISQTILSTLLVLITAEFLPKAIVQINPNRFLNIGTLPLFIVFLILYLPTQCVLFLSGFVLKLTGGKKKTTEKVFSKVDLAHYVDDISSRINNEQAMSNEMVILSNALDFSKVKARDCMIPRTEMVTIEIDDELSHLKELFIEKGLSKIIVYRKSIDNIIGCVHSFDLFKSPKSIKEILKSIEFVPAVMSGKELLEMFTTQSGNIAVVTDEYGGTAGIVTIEDVIEEIFGEIEDEHDKEALKEERISDSEFRFSARVEIDYLINSFKFDIIASDEYDTLGGLIIHELESIPVVGEQLTYRNIRIEIEEVSERRIELVKLTILN
ncbi:MAG: hemolysin family protein [Flavobacteriia bacterium]|nr:hemolysin family protein [Flavobacteriia bacterium]